MGELKSNDSNRIICAATSDYLPILESYGECFTPIAQTKNE